MNADPGTEAGSIALETGSSYTTPHIALVGCVSVVTSYPGVWCVRVQFRHGRCCRPADSVRHLRRGAAQSGRPTLRAVDDAPSWSRVGQDSGLRAQSGDESATEPADPDSESAPSVLQEVNLTVPWAPEMRQPPRPRGLRPGR